jgi:hypothetical protein
MLLPAQITFQHHRTLRKPLGGVPFHAVAVGLCQKCETLVPVEPYGAFIRLATEVYDRKNFWLAGTINGLLNVVLYQPGVIPMVIVPVTCGVVAGLPVESV